MKFAGMCPGMTGDAIGIDVCSSASAAGSFWTRSQDAHRHLVSDSFSDDRPAQVRSPILTPSWGLFVLIEPDVCFAESSLRSCRSGTRSLILNWSTDRFVFPLVFEPQSPGVLSPAAWRLSLMARCAGRVHARRVGCTRLAARGPAHHAASASSVI